jgi:hypothetical protein
MIRPSDVFAEIERIRKQERDKALDKYGPDALQPGGRPEFDILNFACNEVVGLDRYGEMLAHRFAHDPEIVRLGATMRSVSRALAPGLVEARLRLLADGIQLGVPEEERFTLPENKQ